MLERFVVVVAAAAAADIVVVEADSLAAGRRLDDVAVDTFEAAPFDYEEDIPVAAVAVADTRVPGDSQIAEKDIPAVVREDESDQEERQTADGLGGSQYSVERVEQEKWSAAVVDFAVLHMQHVAEAVDSGIELAFLAEWSEDM